MQDYLTLGPLGTALNSTTWPRPLLIDEIDKSDLDFANDLLNVIEEGEYLIPELQRLGTDEAKVKDCLGNLVSVKNGRIESGQFPFVVMTSNGEREFPPPFLRRCVRLKIEDPSPTRLEEIIDSHLAQYPETLASGEIGDLIDAFDKQRRQNEDLATDQLLNAVFLTLAVRDDNQRSFTARDLERLREELLRPLSGPKA